jgi:trimethylamine---corrinoid protein Co-methyltransferase
LLARIRNLSDSSQIAKSDISLSSTQVELDLEMLQILDRKNVQEIHSSALQVLENTGIVIDHADALKALRSAGVKIDQDRKLARFPRRVVQEYVHKSPSHFVQAGRNRKHDLLVKPGSVFARSLSGCSHILDIETGLCREATTEDTKDGARILDSLDNIHFCGGWIYPGDEHPSYRDVSLFKIFLENSEKHICLQAYQGRNLEFMIEMGKVVQGGEKELRRRPILSVVLAPSSPLRLGKFMIDQLDLAGRYGIPALFCSTPIAGATSPITLAGQLVMLHTENLAGIAISQMLHPGAPVVYAPRPNTMDMRTGNASWGSIEFGIMSAACVQLGHYCGLPVDTYSLGSDSKSLDEQAAVERSLNLALPALAGADLLTGAGFIETIRTASFAQAVIDNEILGMLYRTIRGVNVNDDTLALRLIDRIGPGGSYLADKHTRKHVLSEHFIPTIFDRNVRETWERKGARDAVQTAKEKVQEILAKHQPNELDKAVQEDLDSIMTRAKQALYGA